MEVSRKIEAVIFDMGRVLVNVDVNRGIFRHFIEGKNGDENAVAGMMRIESFAQLNAGKITPTQFHLRVCEQFGIELGFEEFKAAWCDVFDPMDGIERLVKGLANNYKLGLLSDTDPMHWEYIRERFEVVRIFKKPALSFETGVCKPDRQAFLNAVKYTETEPEKCLYIDDLDENVCEARRVGMMALQFRGVSILKQELARIGVGYAEG